MPSPSKSQLKAITHGTGSMLVLAGPGSGKTFVIVQRIIHLITNLKVDPASILVISFSRASAKELSQRFIQQTKEQTKVTFSTFHACFFHILKHTSQYTTKDIISPKEQHEILAALLMDPKFEESYRLEKAEEYLGKFSFYKNRGLAAMKEHESERFCGLFHAYQQEMHSRHRLDFDDMGLLCLQLLKRQPTVLTLWQEKFPYILIDEFQDINPIQFEIIRLLAGKNENLFVVGDDDQAIYSFRGSSPQIMLNFKQIYPFARQILLETNFRCSKNIIEESLKVIEQNKQRFPKAIQAHHPPKERVHYQSFEQSTQEYQYLVSQIKERLEEGIEPNKIACIFRTNQQMGGLAEYLYRHQIPFVMKESVKSIFQHPIAKDILSYLQFFREEKRRKDFLLIMNKPLRYFSRNACLFETIRWQDLLDYYQQKPYMLKIIAQMQRQEEWIKKLDLFGAVSYIRKVVGYEAYLKEYSKSQHESWDEWEEILNFIHNSTRELQNLDQWKEEIDAYESALRIAKSSEKEGVHLITMHASKGLEYAYVFLPDCNEGKIPHKKSVTEEEIEEERRMFYVAMTRAIERLEILYIRDKLGKKLQPSRFLPIKRRRDYSSSISSSNSQ